MCQLCWAIQKEKLTSKEIVRAYKEIVLTSEDQEHLVQLEKLVEKNTDLQDRIEDVYKQWETILNEQMD